MDHLGLPFECENSANLTDQSAYFKSQLEYRRLDAVSHIFCLTLGKQNRPEKLCQLHLVFSHSQSTKGNLDIVMLSASLLELRPKILIPTR